MLLDEVKQMQEEVRRLAARNLTPQELHQEKLDFFYALTMRLSQYWGMTIHDEIEILARMVMAL